jgi:hypothetical protein
VSLKIKVYIVDFKVTENNANIYLNTNGGKIKTQWNNYILLHKPSNMQHDAPERSS